MIRHEEAVQQLCETSNLHEQVIESIQTTLHSHSSTLDQITKSFIDLNNKISSIPYPIKHLTQVEMERRRAIGLCFNCEEIYHFKINMWSKEYFFFSLTNPRSRSPNNDPMETLDLMSEQLQKISFHTSVGTSHPTMIRLLSGINNKQIQCQSIQKHA